MQCIFGRKRKKYKLHLGAGAKILLMLHYLFLVTLLIDHLPPLNITTEYSDVNFFLTCLNKLIEYHGFCKQMDTMISSLLVVWTFITAVLIFYIERKDNLYYGVRHWEIISYGISRFIIISFFVLFFVELLFLLIAVRGHMQVTVLYLCFLYVVTAACVLGVVCWATSKKVIRRCYFNRVAHEAAHHIPGTLEEELPSLLTFLSTLHSFGEKEWDLIIEILSEVFAELCDDKNETKRQEAGKLSYRVVRYILENTDDKGKKTDFMIALSNQIYKNVKTYTRPVDVLAALLLPGVEFTGSPESCCYVTALSSIDDADIRQELLIRGIVYSCYLEFLDSPVLTAGVGKYSDVRRELCIKASEGAGRADQWYKVSFVGKIQRAAQVPGFTVAQVDGRL